MAGKRKDPTELQAAIMDTIRRFAAVHAYAPTIRELAEHHGVSWITMREHLSALRRKGLIDWTSGHRTIHIL